MEIMTARQHNSLGVAQRRLQDNDPFRLYEAARIRINQGNGRLDATQYPEVSRLVQALDSMKRNSRPGLEPRIPPPPQASFARFGDPARETQRQLLRQ